MRLSAAEKYEIIQTVTRSEIGVKRTLENFGIARSSFYKWYQSYLEYGYDGLETTKRANTRQWNSIPGKQKNLVVEIALEYTELSARELIRTDFGKKKANKSGIHPKKKTNI